MDSEGAGERSRSRRNISPVVIGMVLVVLASAVGGFAMWKAGRSNPIPDSIGKQVDFTIYYPSRMPKGYSLQKDSVRLADGILFYVLGNNNPSKSITVSSQKHPSNFDEKNLSLAKPFTTSVGTAYDMSTDQKNVYLISTHDEVLMFINTDSKLPGDVIPGLISTLQIVQ